MSCEIPFFVYLYQKSKNPCTIFQAPEGSWHEATASSILGYTTYRSDPSPLIGIFVGTKWIIFEPRQHCIHHPSIKWRLSWWCKDVLRRLSTEPTFALWGSPKSPHRKRATSHLSSEFWFEQRGSFSIPTSTACMHHPSIHQMASVLVRRRVTWLFHQLR